jgi:hypothetical protein
VNSRVNSRPYVYSGKQHRETNTNDYMFVIVEPMSTYTIVTLRLTVERTCSYEWQYAFAHLASHRYSYVSMTNGTNDKLVDIFNY